MRLEIVLNKDYDYDIINGSSLLITQFDSSSSKTIFQRKIQTIKFILIINIAITYYLNRNRLRMSSNTQDEQNESYSLVDQNKRRRLDDKDSDYNFDDDEVGNLTSDNTVDHKEKLANKIANAEEASNETYHKTNFFDEITDRKSFDNEQINVERSIGENDKLIDISKTDFDSKRISENNESNYSNNEPILVSNIKGNSKYNENFLEKSSVDHLISKTFDGISDNCSAPNSAAVHFKVNSSNLSNVDDFSTKISNSSDLLDNNQNTRNECNENNVRRKSSQDTQSGSVVCENQSHMFYPHYRQTSNITGNIVFSDTINETTKENYSSHPENEGTVQKNTNLSLNNVNNCDNDNAQEMTVCTSNNIANTEKNAIREVEINANFPNTVVGQDNCFQQNLSKTNDMITTLWGPHDDFKYTNKQEHGNYRNDNKKNNEEQTNSLSHYKPHQMTQQQQSVDINSHDINRYINEQENFPQQEQSQLQGSNHFLHDPSVFNQMIHNPSDQLQHPNQSQLMNEPHQIQNRDIFLESHHQYSPGQYFKNHQHHVNSQSMHNITAFNGMQQHMQLHGSMSHHSEEKHLQMNAPQLPTYSHSSSEHIRIPHHNQQDSLPIRSNYHHLMDEFHDDPNTTYKLTLSPAVKHEIQDDGYETSAGDVLTPNSHSSSTHSVTSQQVQLGSNASAKVKQEDHPVQSHQQKHINHTHVDSIVENPSRTIQQSQNDEIFFNQRHHQNFNAETSSPSDIKKPLHSNELGDGVTNYHQESIPEGMSLPIQKKRGRKKKIIDPSLMPNNTDANQNGVLKNKERKKHDRFNGMSEEEVSQRQLPDHLCDNLDIVIIGINPGLFAAYKGHHYAGPGNHFWKCLYLSGLTPEQMSSDEDYKLLNCGIGFTNMVPRPTKGSADLTRKEIKEGSRILLEKLQKFQPKIAVFNGKLIFEVFSGKKDFNFGRQPECVEGTNTYIWVMPSSSARCAQLPRAADKVPFYLALKKFRDFLNGVISHMDESECIFTEERIREICPQEKIVQSGVLPNPEGSSPNSINDMTQPSGQMFGTPFPEKKKRGRPKKIKEQLTIDPTTGNIIPSNAQCVKGEELNGILNLSVIGENVVPGKKKRGRPKKIKPMFDVNQSQNLSIPRNGETLATQSPQSSYHKHGSYEEQNSNIQQHIYNKSSPSLNCTFTTSTPPTSNQQASLENQHPDHLNTSTANLSSKNIENDCSSNMLQQTSQVSSTIEPQLGESPPPGSPNICTDFDPPAGTSSRQEESDAKQREVDLQSQRLHIQQRSRYSSPAQEHMPEQHSSDNYQQWMSPQTSASQYSAQHSEQISQLPPHIHYQTENTVENVQLQQNDQWQRNQNFDDTGNNYMMAARHLQIRQAQEGQGSKTNNQDVARKSLSGLESLVDQIPTVSENDTSCTSGPTASAIALENRLQDLQCQQHNQQSNNVASPNETFLCSNRNTGSSISDSQRRPTNIHTSNFSVSNLAESAVSPNTSNTLFGSNASLNSSSNPYRPNIISAAALAAVASNPNTSSAHHVPHAQLYIDPHTHMSHVPSNSMYVAQTHHHSASHHQHHTLTHHHHPAHHHPAYGTSTGAVSATTDYSNPYGLPAQTSTFHMPSPNYPYGYGSPSPQTNYASYMHSHHSHHGHHAHTAHHLSMFERLKPSDIGSYGGF